MNKQAIFIIEHLEPELWPWCVIEYKHISKIIGRNNLWFTNIKQKDKNKLEKYGKVFLQSVSSMNLEKVCVLDPEASETLTIRNSEVYQYFIFGGILGDYPSKKRTEQELTKFIKNAKAFNIGKEQMSTDNAVYVVKKIISGTELEKIKFQDKIEIKINKIESTILPYRYALINGKPLISKELIKFLRKS